MKLIGYFLLILSILIGSLYTYKLYYSQKTNRADTVTAVDSINSAALITEQKLNSISAAQPVHTGVIYPLYLLRKGKSSNKFPVNYQNKPSKHYILSDDRVPIAIPDGKLRSRVISSSKVFQWNERWLAFSSLCQLLDHGNCKLDNLLLRVRDDGVSSTEENKYLPMEYQVVVQNNSTDEQILAMLSRSYEQLVANYFFEHLGQNLELDDSRRLYTSIILTKMSLPWQERFLGNTTVIVELSEERLKRIREWQSVNHREKVWPWHREKSFYHSDDELWELATLERDYWFSTKQSNYSLVSNDIVSLSIEMIKGVLNQRFLINRKSFPIIDTRTRTQI